MDASQLSWKKREGKSCFLSHYFLIIFLKRSKHHLANCNEMRNFPCAEPAVYWSPVNIIRPSEIFVAIRFDRVALCAWADGKTINKA